MLVYQTLRDKLQPYINPQRARTIAGQIAASQTVAKGDVLGQLSNGKYTQAVTTNITAPVAGPTATPAGSDGTLATGVYRVGYTFINAAGGETTMSPTTNVTVASTNHITVTPAALPTGASGVNVYISDSGGNDMHFAYTNDGSANNITANAASAKEPPATNTARVKADGSAIGKVISAYDFATDASGNVYYGTETPQTGPLADPQPTAELYYTGDFLKSDLPGITDNEIADLGATLLGTGADTIVRLP